MKILANMYIKSFVVQISAMFPEKHSTETAEKSEKYVQR